MCQRLVDATPWGQWTTFVAGLRETGIIAPLVLDGPMTGKVFRADNEPEAPLGLSVPQPAADRRPSGPRSRRIVYAIEIRGVTVAHFFHLLNDARHFLIGQDRGLAEGQRLHIQA